MRMKQLIKCSTVFLLCGFLFLAFEETRSQQITEQEMYQARQAYLDSVGHGFLSPGEGRTILPQYSGPRGDFNKDGYINVLDLDMLYNHLNQNQIDEEEKRFDFNADGVVDFSDAEALAKFIAESRGPQSRSIATLELEIDPELNSMTIKDDLGRANNKQYGPASASDIINSLVRLMYSSPVWDGGARIYSFDCALRSFSTNPLLPDVVVTVTKISRPGVTVMEADGGGSGVGAFWNYSSSLGSDGLLSNGEISGKKRWKFSNPNGAAFQVLVNVEATVGKFVDNTGGIVSGSGGVTVTIPPSALSGETVISIGSIGLSSISAPYNEDCVFSGGVYLNAGGSGFNSPVEISMPAPSGVPDGTRLFVAVEIEVSGEKKFAVVDVATVQGGMMTTEPFFPLSGILWSGIIGFFLPQTSYGFVYGVVLENIITPVSGAVVTANLSYFLSMTGFLGTYAIPVHTGNYFVQAFNPVDAATGSTVGYIVNSWSIANSNIFIGPPNPSTEDNIVNGDFENGTTGWTVVGDFRTVSSLGPIAPREGSSMGYISSGGSAYGGASSSIVQSFTIPPGGTKLSLDYNFVSEEYPEFVGSVYNDVFQVTVTTPDGNQEVVFEDVNHASWFSVSGIDFPGGDQTTGQTGWKSAEIDLTKYVGQEITITISVHDVGDTIYDSVGLLDKIRLIIEKVVAIPGHCDPSANGKSTRADVVFVKDGSYGTNWHGFYGDLSAQITDRLGTTDAFSSHTNSFNFWYFYSEGTAGQYISADNHPDHVLPSDYQTEAALFADADVIIHKHGCDWRDYSSGHTFSSGVGNCCIPLIQTDKTFVHELAHAAFLLGDEYCDDVYGSDPAAYAGIYENVFVDENDCHTYAGSHSINESSCSPYCGSLETQLTTLYRICGDCLMRSQCNEQFGVACVNHVTSVFSSNYSGSSRVLVNSCVNSFFKQRAFRLLVSSV